MRSHLRTLVWQMAGFCVLAMATSAFAQLGLPLDEENLPDPPPRLNPNADPQDAETDREDNRQQALSILQTGQHFAMQNVQSGEPRLVLRGVLQFLELERSGTAGMMSPLEAMQHFAELAWEQKPKETRRQMLLRLMNADEPEPMEEEPEAPFPQGRVGPDQEAQERQLAHQYQENIGQVWPLDWRPNQAKWAEFLETLLEGQAADDPVEFWKKKIAADPAKADSYRLAYLAIARAKRETEFDRDLLAPWLEASKPVKPQQIQRLAELLNSVQTASLAADDPVRRDFRDRFLQALRSVDLGAESFDSPMGHAVRSVISAMDPDGRVVRQEILNHQPPRVFLRLMNHGSEGREEIFAAFFGKRIKIDWKDKPLEKGIEELAAMVAAPLWIDKSMRGRTNPIRLTHEGPWLATLDKVLEETDCEARFFSQHVLWIGQKSQRKAAEAMYREATSRLAGYEGFSEEEVVELTAPVDETPKNFTEFVDHWNESETAVIRIRLLDRSVRSRPIQPPSHLLPLALRLSLIAESADLDWRVDRAIVIFASKARIALIEERENRLQRRLVPLAERTDRVANALREPSNVDFDGTLAELLKIIGQNDPLPVLYLTESKNGPAPDSPAAIQSDGSPLAHGLDVMTAELNLDWAEDEKALYIGTTASLSTLARRELLQRKRSPPSSEDAVRLEKPITSIRSDRDLNHLGGQIAAMLKRELDISAVPEEVKRRSYQLFAHRIPLEQVMDALAAQNGLKWELTPTQLKFSPADRGP